MGQQQLLLIVLGVILVGVAVVLGIQYFGTGAEEGAKNELLAHSQIIGSTAQEWFNKPASMDGGGLTFAGFKAYFDDKLLKLHSTTYGDYTIPDDGDATSIVILATPKGATGYTWTVSTTVKVDSVNAVIDYP